MIQKAPWVSRWGSWTVATKSLSFPWQESCPGSAMDSGTRALEMLAWCQHTLGHCSALTLSEGHCSRELVLHPSATALWQIMSAQHDGGGQPSPAAASPHLSFTLSLEERKHREKERFEESQRSAVFQGTSSLRRGWRI